MGGRRHGGADNVLYPDARPGCRRRRGGGGVAVPAMTNGMPSLPEGFRLRRYETIGSTNDEARRLAREGAPEGTLVWADAQEAGRGRRGRPWLSPLGNLYLSLVLRPDAPSSRAPQLGFVTALALGEAVRVRLETLTLEGRFLDLDQDGALVIETGGNRRRIAAGEVFPALG